MYTPSLAEVKNLAKDGNLVPVYREILADLETPVSAYMKVAAQGSSFLLESVEGGERLARYSFIGCSPFLTVRINAGQATLHRQGRSPERRAVSNPMDLVRELIGQHRQVSVVRASTLSWWCRWLPGLRVFSLLRTPSRAFERPVGFAGSDIAVHRYATRLRPHPAQNQSSESRQLRRWD